MSMAEKIEIELCDVEVPGDLELILAWRSNPLIYKWFYQQKGPLKWEDHFFHWSEKKPRKDWIIKYNGRKVGSVFVVFMEGIADVGIYVGEVTLWGKGIGNAALAQAVLWLRGQKYREARARINKENTVSKIVFEKAGFIYEGDWPEDNRWDTYRIQL